MNDCPQTDHENPVGQPYSATHVEQLRVTSAQHSPLDMLLAHNPIGPSQAVLRSISPQLKSLSHYPSIYASELKRQISECFMFHPDQISVGMGAEGTLEAILAALLEPDEEVIVPELSFPNFNNLVTRQKARIIKTERGRDLRIDFEDLRSRLTSQTKCILLANPNNPTGLKEDIHQLKSLIQDFHGYLIIDEACLFHELDSLLPLVTPHGRVVVVRSFSKRYGLPGMRLGFSMSSLEVAQRVNDRLLPFSTPQLHLVLGQAALQDHCHQRQTQQFITEELSNLEHALHQRGLAMLPSRSSFFFLRVPSSFNTSSTFVRALARYQCFVVDGLHFGITGSSFVRVALRDSETNRRFIRVLDTLLANKYFGGRMNLQKGKRDSASRRPHDTPHLTPNSLTEL